MAHRVRGVRQVRGFRRVLRASSWLVALAVIAVVAGIAVLALPEWRSGLEGTRGTALSSVGGAATTPAPSRVIEQTFHSDILGRDLPYTVFLPPGSTSGGGQRYPVLYMLHGIGGNHATEWPGYGLLDAAAALIARGEVRPFIIVLPEGEDGYWVDHVDGPAWGRYLARDVVTEVDRSFPTIPNAGARAIGGNSMGGHGALQVAINFPGTFGIVGAHSPTLRPFETAPPYFGDTRQFAARDPASLVAAQPEAARRLRIALDVGADDSWRPGVEQLHARLVAAGVPHTLEVLPGDHSDAYWSRNVEHYLRTYAAAFSP